MSERPYKVLILDWDEDTLISLQQVLENAGVDTTITWDEREARKLFKDKPFDLVLVGDHPPELIAETILHDFNFDLSSCPCLLLAASQDSSEHFRKVGISQAIPKRDPFRVLAAVQELCQSQRSDTHLRAAGSCEHPPAASSLLNSIGQAA